MANNPKGKGGFSDNPQNINDKGRPPKGYSITEMAREMLSAEPNLKKAIISAAIEKAVKDKDVAAMRLMWQYMDGMPQQDVVSDGKKIEGLVIIKDGDSS